MSSYKIQRSVIIFNILMCTRCRRCKELYFFDYFNHITCFSSNVTNLLIESSHFSPTFISRLPNANSTNSADRKQQFDPNPINPRPWAILIVNSSAFLWGYWLNCDIYSVPLAFFNLRTPVTMIY